MQTFTKRASLLLALLLCSTMAVVAQMQTPQPSPGASIKQTIGVTDVTVVYSRPSVKGRTIWGELVPYGEVWRTGANATTTIEFSTDVTLAGQAVPKGKYGLFTIPAKDGAWTFILNKTATGNISGYKAETDLFRTTVPVMASAHTESFQFEFADVMADKATLIWRWDKTAMALPITIKTVEIAAANISAGLETARGNYVSAANYYFTAGDHAKALTTINQALALQDDAWGNWVKSRILGAQKNTTEAIKTAEHSTELAKMEKDDNSEFFIGDNTKNIATWKAGK
jgi:hypothetical protein